MGGEISWEKAGGEQHQGSSQGTAPSTGSSPTAAAHRAQPLVCPHSLLPPPQPCRTGKVCALQLQHHNVKSTSHTAGSPSSHWFPLAMAVVGLIHMTVVPAAHCFYSTGTISARMCGSCLLCLVPASGSFQVPRTGGHLKEPRGLSGSEARDEEGTPFPAHQKASITFLPLKITGRTALEFKKPSVQPWHLANPTKILLMLTSDNQFPLRKDFHSCHLLSHSQG